MIDLASFAWSFEISSQDQLFKLQVLMHLATAKVVSSSTIFSTVVMCVHFVSLEPKISYRSFGD